MGEFIVYIHCDDTLGQRSYTKKNYLLELEKRMGWGLFKDFSEAEKTPDFVLNIQPSDKTIWQGKRWTGFWHIDAAIDGYPVQKYALMDTIFPATTQSVYRGFEGEKQQILFQAADPTIHKRIPEIPQDYDYVICGTITEKIPFYHERVRLHELLKEQFSCRDFGKGYTPQEYTTNINSARIQWVQSGTNEFGGYCAQRFFECLAIGPVLCQWNPDLNHLGLIEGTDYVAYRNDTDLIFQFKSLLANKERRDLIARNGRRKALMYHSYEQRAMAIYNVAREYSK